MPCAAWLEPIKQTNEHPGDQEEQSNDRDDEYIHTASYAMGDLAATLPRGVRANRDLYVFYTGEDRFPIRSIRRAWFHGNGESCRQVLGGTVILSAILKKQSADASEVRYVGSYPRAHSFLVSEIVIKSADLPDPPPDSLHLSLSWSTPQVTMAETKPGREVQQSQAGAERGVIRGGVRVKVRTSRLSTVKSPPERPEQHIDKIGTVLWTTPTGANVDLDGETVWFGYDELELVQQIAQRCRERQR